MDQLAVFLKYGIPGIALVSLAFCYRLLIAHRNGPERPQFARLIYFYMGFSIIMISVSFAYWVFDRAELSPQATCEDISGHWKRGPNATEFKDATLDLQQSGCFVSGTMTVPNTTYTDAYGTHPSGHSLKLNVVADHAVGFAVRQIDRCRDIMGILVSAHKNGTTTMTFNDTYCGKDIRTNDWEWER